MGCDFEYVVTDYCDSATVLRCNSMSWDVCSARCFAGSYKYFAVRSGETRACAASAMVAGAQILPRVPADIRGNIAPQLDAICIVISVQVGLLVPTNLGK